jgi:hypothetical protein
MARLIGDLVLRTSASKSELLIAPACNGAPDIGSRT